MSDQEETLFPKKYANVLNSLALLWVRAEALVAGRLNFLRALVAGNLDFLRGYLANGIFSSEEPKNYWI